jgi:mono/diheme cytochrome c family protein
LLSIGGVRTFFTLATVLAAIPGVGNAGVGGSYAGTLRLGGTSASVEAAAALSDLDGALGGTVVVALDEPSLAGAYTVQGKRKGGRVRLRGVNPAGARLVVRAKSGGAGLAGRAKVRLGDRRAKGHLDLVLLPPSGDGSSCDGVFTDHEAFFTTEVLSGVLVPVCAACHTEGGQAHATRLRVVASDALATARSTILVIDPATPAESLLLAKPLARVPHGGGAQLTEGSVEAQALAEWVTLVGQADCAGPTTPTTGAEVYAVHCAGCHGADAAGLDGRPAVRCTVPERLVDAVRRGRGDAATGMPAFVASQLPDDQLVLLEAYLAGLCSGAAGDVYASNCATCHGATAGGGRNADGVRGPDIQCKDAGDFDEVLRRGEERMPAFPSLAGAPASALADYVSGFCSSM